VELKSDTVVGLGTGWPMYCGVPFPRGVLQDVGRVRIVTAAGAAVPAQVRPLAFWTGTKDVRWLNVDYLGDPAAAHYLEVADRAADHGRAIADFLTEEAAAFRVCTGPALFIVPKQGPLLSRAFLDVNGDGRFDTDEELVQNDTGDDLYVVDNRGRKAVVGRDPTVVQTRAEPDVAELRRQGDPLHACIRREGWYVAEDGERLARHITRLHFYRGQRFVRIEHTLVLTEDTNRLWFRDIGLTVRHRTPVPHPVVFDSSHEPDDNVFRTELPEDRDSLFMFQERAFFYSRLDPLQDCRFRIARAGADGKTEVLQSGGRCGEWVNVAGPRAGITLVLRNFWQQFPKEFEVGRGAVTAHLWSPRGGRELDLRTPTLIETWPKDWFNADYHAGGSYGVYYQSLLKAPSNGLGLAKTHELLLCLHPAGEPESQRKKTVDAFLRPVLCLADPWWLWKTEATDAIYPYDPQRFRREEAFMREYFGAVTSASTNRYPLGGMAAAMDALVRYDQPVEPIPQVQQSGAGPRCLAVFRKTDTEKEVVLYVRSRLPLRPAVTDLAGRPVEGALYEPLEGHLVYTAKPAERPVSFRVRVPATAAPGDYVLDPGSSGENWEVTWSTAVRIVLFAPDGFVTGCGRVWESWPPHLFKPGAPVLARPIWCYFSVPKGVGRFSLSTSKPIEILAPDGQPVAAARGKTGLFEVEVPKNHPPLKAPDRRAGVGTTSPLAAPASAPPGLWRMRAVEATTIKVQGIAPIFAADVPERYFLPDTSKISVQQWSRSD
jgi:hypothetical protein